MNDVAFLFSNPRHHLEMMVPVARELTRRGHAPYFVSLAELRGLDTPKLDLPVHRVLPYNIRRKPSVGQRIGHPSGSHFWIREAAQRAVGAVLYPRLRRLIRGARVAVIPNDSAFPYRGFVESTRSRVPFVLLQEGIRFDFPNGDPYGTCGVSALCAWGIGSAELFARRGVGSEILHVTGTPRLDALDPTKSRGEGRALREKLSLHKRTIAYLSNPIEQQGFGTARDRLALFEGFLRDALPVLEERDLAVLVKNHAGEDVTAYEAIAAQSAARDRVRVLRDASLFAVLAACDAAIVLTSTVGIDAMLFGLPVGALEIPQHGFGFEYVSHGGAVAIHGKTTADDLRALLDTVEPRRSAHEAFLARHLYDRGGATKNVADVVAKFLS